MIYPIIAYGDPVLRKETEEITSSYPKLQELLEDMFETMYASYGIGLAAPQIGLSIRLFVVDASPFEDDEDLSEEERRFLKDFKKVFINAKILNETGNEWAFNEGCLSIPDVREDVFRKESLVIEYWDENFQKHTDTISGIAARIIQHEYDHIEGILFTDRLTPLKKRLIKSKLNNISKGNVKVDYRMKFPIAKKKR
ncbi:MAG TPA: peptide deformylase [Flavobacteriaceae bacterium]|nr:peptide deformylase [Flavobacteriaceae bacterium]MCB9212405.1 peptide deformylase [Alteromonas sp.]HPF11681.1 peptide deformylase [Flavobacteriaceae bacterium]HQU20156.1 peptide deformylase [Flavobacteriaceae bacterium]HQU64755.1 peptide deformylase [Flavobacteriaceae bacterium]